MKKAEIRKQEEVLLHLRVASIESKLRFGGSDWKGSKTVYFYTLPARDSYATRAISEALSVCNDAEASINFTDGSLVLRLDFFGTRDIVRITIPAEWKAINKAIAHSRAKDNLNRPLRYSIVEYIPLSTLEEYEARTIAGTKTPSAGWTSYLVPSRPCEIIDEEAQAVLTYPLNPFKLADGKKVKMLKHLTCRPWYEVPCGY